MKALRKVVIYMLLLHQLLLNCVSQEVKEGGPSSDREYNVSRVDPQQGLEVDSDELEERTERVVSNIVVTVEQGNLRGVIMTSVKDNSSFFGFLGVPYAEPPVGELRFKSPQPAVAWRDEFIANRSDVVCVQANAVSTEIEGTEDCLVLNIYTAKLPSNASDLPLPVMVWIHGGGFEMGSGNTDIYGPDYFVVQNVIIVSINYRLGALGFLNLKDDSISKNVGLKDQVAALKWIKRNIASFGGDANQVTIFGESAGAACVHYHMMSPMSKGLFHRAISQSGSALNPWAYSTSAQSRALLLSKTLGCESRNSTEMIKCLRSAKSYEIVANAHNHTLTKEDERHYIRLPFVPSSEEGYDGVDEVFLPGNPIDLMTSGRFHRDIPYITGVNSIEAALFLPKLTSKAMLAEFDGEFDRLIPADILLENPKQRQFFSKRIKTFYFGRESISDRSLSNFVNMLTDLLFNIGTYQTVKIHSKYATNPIFMYQFSFDGSLGFAKRLISQTKIPGAVHSDDLGYLFKVSFWDLNLAEDTPEMKTLSRMVKMWTNFAKTGNPSSELDNVLNLKWAPVTKLQLSYLSIDNDLRMRVGLAKERMSFWDQLYEDAVQEWNEVDSEPSDHETPPQRSSSVSFHYCSQSQHLVIGFVAVYLAKMYLLLSS